MSDKLYNTKVFKPATVVVPYSKGRNVTVMPAINCDAGNEEGYVFAFSTGFRVFLSMDALRAMGEGFLKAEHKMEEILSERNAEHEETA